MIFRCAKSKRNEEEEFFCDHNVSPENVLYRDLLALEVVINVAVRFVLFFTCKQLRNELVTFRTIYCFMLLSCHLLLRFFVRLACANGIYKFCIPIQSKARRLLRIIWIVTFKEFLHQERSLHLQKMGFTQSLQLFGVRSYERSTTLLRVHVLRLLVRQLLYWRLRIRAWRIWWWSKSVLTDRNYIRCWLRYLRCCVFYDFAHSINLF